MKVLLSSAVAVYGAAFLIISATYSCQSPTGGSSPNTGASGTDTVRKPVRLITLDPGHFHAALVQKSMYEEVDPVVHVYAPAGPDVQLHLDRIRAYNGRPTDPTHWAEEVYTGPDFFQKMIVDKPGNTVVLSGNNREKADYILGSLKAGLNVLADKPMVIDSAGFVLLRQAFDTAARQQLLLYDIMTERFEIQHRSCNANFRCCLIFSGRWRKEMRPIRALLWRASIIFISRSREKR